MHNTTIRSLARLVQHRAAKPIGALLTSHGRRLARSAAALWPSGVCLIAYSESICS